MALPLDFIPNDRVSSAGRGRTSRVPRSDARCRRPRTRKARRPKDLPAYLASLYEVPLLTREQEAHQFRKYNYLKYKAAKLRDQLDPAAAVQGR